MELLRLPFFRALDGSSRILLAGAGGGFDVFCGLPLYFGLRDAGKAVHLANLSFSALHAASGRWLTPALLEVTADSGGSASYFPERHLSRWFRDRGEEVPIYSFARTGVGPLRDGYRALVAALGVDTILLVDGGTDSLMRGDEVGLGTPHEDASSLAAVDDVEVARKLLVCLGFGVDAFHGVCHSHFLEAVADLTRQGAFLGAFSLTPDMPEVELYRSATRSVFEAMPRHPSIVSSSILSALEGRYGDHHATARTAGSTLWINPLMALYWSFHLGPVARRLLYLEAIKATETWIEVGLAIERFRHEFPGPIRPWFEIPV